MQSAGMLYGLTRKPCTMRKRFNLDRKMEAQELDVPEDRVPRAWLPAAIRAIAAEGRGQRPQRLELLG
jgi:hypothetical protein